MDPVPMQNTLHFSNLTEKISQSEILIVFNNYSNFFHLVISITAYLEENLRLITAFPKSKIRLQNIVEKRRNCSWGNLYF